MCLKVPRRISPRLATQAPKQSDGETPQTKRRRLCPRNVIPPGMRHRARYQPRDTLWQQQVRNKVFEALDPDTFWGAVFENPQHIFSLARELDAFLMLPNEQRSSIIVTYCRKDPPRGSLRPVPVRDMTQWADLGSRTGEMRKRLISLCPEGSLACYYTASESEQEVQCLGEMMLCV